MRVGNELQSCRGDSLFVAEGGNEERERMRTENFPQFDNIKDKGKTTRWNMDSGIGDVTDDPKTFSIVYKVWLYIFLII